MQNEKIYQLGIDRKMLYVHVKGYIAPKYFGTLHQVKMLGSKETITLNGETVRVPDIIRAFAHNLTPALLDWADTCTDEEFFLDFYNDFVEMDHEGELKLLSISNTWD